MAAKTHRVLPGFGLALGYTLVYLSLLILLPLGGMILKASELGFAQIIDKMCIRDSVCPLVCATEVGHSSRNRGRGLGRTAIIRGLHQLPKTASQTPWSCLLYTSRCV